MPTTKDKAEATAERGPAKGGEPKAEVVKTTKKAVTKTKSEDSSLKKPVSSLKPDKIDPILRKLLEAGAHFGHQSSRWNPKMASYIYTTRGGVHIFDLTQTASQLAAAKKFITDTAERGGKVLFVGTKRQAKAPLTEAAIAAGMPYVTYRWLGGMLTNLDTIGKRVTRLKKLRQDQAENGFAGMSKKDRSKLERELELLEKVFGGIADMAEVPAIVYVVDMPREHNALLEARKLGIPIIAICDSNADPELVDYPIPANNDAVSAITLITGEIADAAKAGSDIYASKTAADEAKAEGERLKAEAKAAADKAAEVAKLEKEAEKAASKEQKTEIKESK